MVTLVDFHCSVTIVRMYFCLTQVSCSLCGLTHNNAIDNVSLMALSLALKHFNSPFNMSILILFLQLWGWFHIHA